eukprot:7945933-Pyramimonas_sp.AAC.1
MHPHDCTLNTVTTRAAGSRGEPHQRGRVRRLLPVPHAPLDQDAARALHPSPPVRHPHSLRLHFTSPTIPIRVVLNHRMLPRTRVHHPTPLRPPGRRGPSDVLPCAGRAIRCSPSGRAPCRSDMPAAEEVVHQAEGDVVDAVRRSQRGERLTDVGSAVRPRSARLSRQQAAEPLERRNGVAILMRSVVIIQCLLDACPAENAAVMTRALYCGRGYWSRLLRDCRAD